MKAISAGLVIKVITLLSMVTLLGAQRTKAQTVTSFNFSDASQPVTGWINVTGDPSLTVRIATDPATGITISSVATANWSQFNSICSFDGLGATGGSFFPAAVMLNHWFNYDGTLANYQPVNSPNSGSNFPFLLFSMFGKCMLPIRPVMKTLILSSPTVTPTAS